MAAFRVFPLLTVAGLFMFTVAGKTDSNRRRVVRDNLDCINSAASSDPFETSTCTATVILTLHQDAAIPSPSIKEIKTAEDYLDRINSQDPFQAETVTQTLHQDIMEAALRAFSSASLKEIAWMEIETAAGHFDRINSATSKDPLYIDMLTVLRLMYLFIVIGFCRIGIAHATNMLKEWLSSTETITPPLHRDKVIPPNKVLIFYNHSPSGPVHLILCEHKVQSSLGFEKT